MDHYSFRHQDGLELIVCNPIEARGFKNAFSTRLGGVSPLPVSALSLGNLSQDERENVFENRRRFTAALGVSDWQLVTARQIHSADVHPVLQNRPNRPNREDWQNRSNREDWQNRSNPANPANPQDQSIGGDAPVCDALTSNLERTLLAVQTADCLPVLIADPRTGAFAAVHAGWRGTLAGIVARTIEQMQMHYDSRPADLLAALGPAIGPCCFEIGPEVIAQFRASYGYLDDLVSKMQDNGKAYFDLNRANLRQLADCGLQAASIFNLNLCTVCRRDLFFSYRAEKGAERPVGRLMGVIGKSL